MKKIFLIFILSFSFGIVAFAQDGGSLAAAWAWYLSRSSGLIAFALLYLSIFFGLAIRISFFRKIFSGSNSLELHSLLGLQALIFSLLHGIVLIFDKTLNFKLKDVLIPFASSYQPYLLALGIIGFYLMLLLVVSAYARKHLPHAVFRSLHSLSAGLYMIVFVHALYLGTDLKEGFLRSFFIWANTILALLFVYNLFLRLILNQRKQNANLYKSNSESFKK